MEINGKRVVDATKPISIHITKRDTTDGDNKNPSSCAAARAVKRDVPECVSARVLTDDLSGELSAPRR